MKGSNNNNGSRNRNSRTSRSGKNQRRANNSRTRTQTKSFNSREEAETDMHSKGANDPSFYNANAQLLSDAASISFNTPIGLPIDSLTTENSVNGHVAAARNPYRVPGVMAIEVQPIYGIDPNCTDVRVHPITVAARNFYSFIRHANSGHTNYENADLMMYLCSVTEMCSYHAFLVRLYGTLNAGSRINRYYPEAVVRAMNVDYSDLTKNIAELRYYINHLAVSISKLCVPSCFSLLRRRMQIYTDLYLDGSTSKSQTMLFVPRGFYRYSATGSTTGTSLAFQPWTTRSTPYKFADIVRFGTDLVNALMADDDVGTYSGDILKAYGDGGCVTLPMIPDEYTVGPCFNAEVLAQIHNLDVFSWSTGSVTQRDGFIYQDVSYTHNFANDAAWTAGAEMVENIYNFCKLPKLLDLPVDQPSPELTMVSTRLMAVAKEDRTNTTLTVYPITTGAEVVTSVYNVTSGGYSRRSPVYGSWVSVNKDGVSDWNEGALIATTFFTKFNMAPTFYVSTDVQAVDVLGELDNYTIIGENELRKMNDAALLSLWNLS